MRKKALLLAVLLAPVTLAAQRWVPSEWPVLTSYDSDHLQRVALPLGGIGTGTVSLGGRGEIRDWEIMNVPGKGNSTVTTGNDASWPKGRLEVPLPYFPEAMTGFEYSAAVGMIYGGQVEDGLKCIKAIRDRFDGAKRNPFDEPECGKHYARSMASWAAVLALSGFHYSGVDKTMSFTSKPGKYFWSNGSAFGICEVGSSSVRLEVLKGYLGLDSLFLKDRSKPIAKKISLSEGDSMAFNI